MTIKVVKVLISAEADQPVSIHFEGDNGKPYKICKSMRRVVVTAWGPDANAYVGRRMTLYRDPTVKFGGMEVGGIRISHMSDIPKPMTIALTFTRANRKPFTVKPMENENGKSKPTVADWVANSLPPMLNACETPDDLDKVQSSKAFLAAKERGTDADRADIERLIASTSERFERSSGSEATDPFDDAVRLAGGNEK